MDEAGYGPNLGPLVIGGSAWLIPSEVDEFKLCDFFSNVFSAAPWKAGCQHVPLGDSKKLYHSGSSLKSLEIGLLAMLTVAGQSGDSVESLLGSMSGNVMSGPENPPWYHAISELQIPSDPSLTDEINRMQQLAQAKLIQHGIELVACRATIITEPDFNRRVGQYNSKGLVLSLATLDLVSQLLQLDGCQRAEIYCDRQGGRKNYLPLLLEWMPDAWFAETGQTATRCSYRTSSAPVLDIHFTVGGDSFPPTALASMIAKYLRERLMEAFNAYWINHCPGLKPTAGYPQDAGRFRQTIQPVAQLNSLATDLWWRQR